MSWLKQWWAWRRARPNHCDYASATRIPLRFHPDFQNDLSLWMLDRPRWRNRDALGR